MKKETQNLLEELLDFYAYRKPGPLLQNAYEQIEKIELYSNVLKIFSWQYMERLPHMGWDTSALPLIKIQQDRFIFFSKLALK